MLLSSTCGCCGQFCQFAEHMLTGNGRCGVVTAMFLVRPLPGLGT